MLKLFTLNSEIRMLINPMENLSEYLNEQLREENKNNYLHACRKIHNLTGNQENVN